MRVAVVGSYGVGMTMNVPRLPRVGETVSGGSFSQGPGGKGSNHAIGAARLGAEVQLLTAVGPDAHGEQARALWEEEGVGHDHVVTLSEPTMIGFIMVDGAGENRIALAPGALEQLTPEHVRDFADVLADADVVVVSLEIPLPTAIAALRIACDAGTTTVLNPAPARSVPSEAWRWVDVVTPNHGEARTLIGGCSDTLPPERILTRLRSQAGCAIALTLGSAGAIVDDGDSLYPSPPVPPRRVVDTTGAGDAFTAALATSLASGEPMHAAARNGCAAGAWSVGVHEVIPSLPRKHEIEALLNGDVA
ncbi:ribokinase [Spiractinospora alimapuensis]|uniref:ribokinase n=1 Tax=Spiractinospora alimapuensis TaxID=2820884 RepID=UPI0022AB01D4|nr:ribokinase [Spiractinospora alimapuensis]QVQ51579.1 ribokinase [Spiractinospora alimapuensis]